MDYSTLRILHLTGLALTFMGLAGILASRAATNGIGVFKQRYIFHVAHGFGLLLIVVTGFALANTLGVLQSAPLWLKAKMVIWLLAGASMVLAARFSRYAEVVLVTFTALVLTAAWLAINKPF